MSLCSWGKLFNNASKYLITKLKSIKRDPKREVEGDGSHHYKTE